MKYQTFSNLQFRPLLKFFFIVFTLTWETRAVKKKLLYLSVSLVLFWSSEKTPPFNSNLKDVRRWLLYDKYKIHSLEVLFDNGDWDEVALHKFLRELQVRFCVNISSQLQNAWVLTCWTSLRQKLQRLLIVERISRQLQRLWDDRHWENSWVVLAGKKLQAESCQQNLKNQRVGREDTFLQTFLIIHVEQFPVPTFCGSLWKAWTVIYNIFLSHEQEKYPTNSLNENCIGFEFQTDPIYYVDLSQMFLALKLKFVNDCG